jgi:molecular chaperone DnaJ
MATEKDYYQLLEITRNASDEEIKKAFRKQAMKYHPDRNPGDKAAEEKFKEVNEAYEVLSNPEKRKMYDQFGSAAFSQGGFRPGGGGAQNFDFEDIFGGTGFEDIFSSFFGGGGRGRGGQGAGGQGGSRSRSRQTRGSDIRADITLELTDVLNDKNLKIKVRRNEVCDTCHGSGSRSGRAASTCPACGGTGAVRTTQGFFSISTTCPTCHGTGSVISDPCPACRGEGVDDKDSTITVKIPAGVDDGMRLRVAEEGDVGRNGGPRGDLYVLIHIRNNTPFERREGDLFGKLHISYSRAVFGGTVDADAIDGKKKIQLHPGVQSGHIITLHGEGIPDIRTRTRGDLNYEVVIDVPKNLKAKEKELLREFARLQGEIL